MLYHVDSFTAVPFAGNPAAVCLLDGPADDAWMQAVAAEMNLSETAFVRARPDGAFDLRWFTPAMEVDLCGHATLASAHVLWETARLRPDSPAVFHTLSGPLTATKGPDRIRMDFPADPSSSCAAPGGFAAALGAVPDEVERSRINYIASFPDEATVRGLAPDFRALARLAPHGVIVTSRADDSAYDFVSRYFAPSFGIDEDPVTGSAHCCLGPFWASRLGRDELTAFQASRRGGAVHVRVAGDRVILGGEAVTVMSSALCPAARCDAAAG